MFLERRTVSRKTPRDGRLEITGAAAARLAHGGATLRIEVAGRSAPATVDTMTCTCRGGEHPHEHYFVQSQLLKELTVGSEVDLTVNASGDVITVRGAD
jgi:hypothetical protein